jgi:hypothetical protein
MVSKKKSFVFGNFLRFIQSNYLVLLIVIVAFLFRVFNLNKFLGFYFDQGRDALVIWDFIKNGKPFLIGPTIGPTMGVGDVPRGPWYLWILIPFYWLGDGNPVFPAWFLVFSIAVGIFILYFISLKMGGRLLAFLSLIISSFSFSLILSSHWLSNPTFMYFISVVFLWSLFEILNGNKKAFFLSALISGMSVHFGGSADIFYPLIAFIIAFIWSRKIINFKNVLFFSLLYLFPFLPQVAFDIRHDGIIRNGLIQFINSGRSFNFSFWDVILSRISLYLKTFSEVVWGENNFWFILFFVFLLIFMIARFKKLTKNKYFSMILISLFVPLLGMSFFRGDRGVIYGYYFTGYYLFFVVFFCFLLSEFSKIRFGLVVLFLFVFLFLGRNIYLLSKYFTSDFRRYNPITLEDQLKAIDWIYNDANLQDFNVDVYVPPVIPYAYDYLFRWYGLKKYGYLPKEDKIDLLYTLSEDDDLHPERLEKWLSRQDTIGKVQKEERFVKIKVEKRLRI